jgi:hypothetical protein
MASGSSSPRKICVEPPGVSERFRDGVVMAANFTVVDAAGTVVNLAGLVRVLADSFADAGQVGDDVFDTPLVAGGLRVRARGVQVCTDFQFQASSHNGREMAIETDGGDG